MSEKRLKQAFHGCRGFFLEITQPAQLCKRAKLTRRWGYTPRVPLIFSGALSYKASGLFDLPHYEDLPC